MNLSKVNIRYLAVFFVIIAFLHFSFDGFSQRTKESGQGNQGENSQNEQKSFMDKLYFGGNLGVQFGTITLINVSPDVGLALTNKFSIGIGLTYQFYQDNQPYYGSRYRSHMFGGRGYARYYIYRDLFVQGEYELLNYDVIVNSFGDIERVTVHSYFIGGGYRQWIGQRAFMSFTVLWNLNENPYYPYANPVIRIGAGIGF